MPKPKTQARPGAGIEAGPVQWVPTGWWTPKDVDAGPPVVGVQPNGRPGKLQSYPD